MTTDDTGPPGEVGGDPTAEAASRTIITDTSTPHHQDTGQSQGSRYARQCAAWARRRRQASWRCVPLDCGCPDPWPCRCTDPPLSDRALDGWSAAARHVLDGGRIPLLPLEVRRALWRRGGDDRVLAVRLHEAVCGEAA